MFLAILQQIFKMMTKSMKNLAFIVHRICGCNTTKYIYETRDTRFIKKTGEDQIIRHHAAVCMYISCVVGTKLNNVFFYEPAQLCQKLKLLGKDTCDCFNVISLTCFFTQESSVLEEGTMHKPTNLELKLSFLLKEWLWQQSNSR
jgi:hypothetical protein